MAEKSNIIRNEGSIRFRTRLLNNYENKINLHPYHCCYSSYRIQCKRGNEQD